MCRIKSDAIRSWSSMAAMRSRLLHIKYERPPRATLASAPWRVSQRYKLSVLKSIPRRNEILKYLLLLAGPGIGPTIGIGEEVGFVVNAKRAGNGKVSCLVQTPDGTEVEANVIENEDGTFDIFYTASEPGTYVIYVRFGGENIPHSPFQVMVSFSPGGLFIIFY